MLLVLLLLGNVRVTAVTQLCRSALNYVSGLHLAWPTAKEKQMCSLPNNLGALSAPDELLDAAGVCLLWRLTSCAPKGGKARAKGRVFVLTYWALCVWVFGLCLTHFETNLYHVLI